ncbi:MAG TPA: Scr1 family TA system antitoxin-like transcriptional regulator [Pseudonocardiaceae bacterium]|nr:Scr1 family TA system antitoxin-like transcriptional regulator [Pseudonocardiaceae bacterium]
MGAQKLVTVVLSGLGKEVQYIREQRVVYLEGMGSSNYLELPEKIDYFRRHAAELAKAALDPAESVKFVAEIAGGYERQHRGEAPVSGAAVKARRIA